MNRYSPIWDHLKSADNPLDATVTLKAPSESHAEIVRGVRDLKTKDKGFALMHLDKGNKYILRHRSKHMQLEFYLTCHAAYGI